MKRRRRKTGSVLWARIRGRKGAVALVTAVLLTAILGMVACAFDIGWLATTRTQLVAVADSSALAGGTELLDGLGLFATKTKSQVAAASGPVAVEYAARNPNAAINNSLVDEDRDIEFGEAHWVAATEDDPGYWKRTTPPEEGNRDYYNYVRVRAHRNMEGGADDGPVPLFFARIFGIDDLPLEAVATAVILPANGFQVNEGSDDTANIMPFAFKREIWDRYERAQDYYDSHPTVLADGNLESILDVNGPHPTDPLFGGLDDDDDFVQLFFDDYTRTESGTVTSGSDAKLEVDIYPRNLKFGGEPTSGNFGTIDLGAGNNSTTDIKRQIVEGLNADDLSYFENNEIILHPDDPLDVEGDTGISAGIKSALESVVGQCKAIALFESMSGPGNNAVYQLVEFQAVTVIHVNFSGSNKELRVQRCKLVDDNAIGDPTGTIGPDTTIFTPLILIE